MKIVTDERSIEYSSPGHPERPWRIRGSLDFLKKQKELAVDWLAPQKVEDAQILRAHSAEHFKRLSSQVDFDADTPAYPKIEDHAKRSVGAALEALKMGIGGQPNFSLIRPPGHHATRDQIMGFCYLNSIAIAALEAQQKGFKKIAVFDFDVHHGNGTEDILLGREGFGFFSIHQLPGYPGSGAGHIKNARNYPVRPARPRAEYVETLRTALNDLKSYKPDLIGVSAGFDAFKNDPLSNARLEIEDYHWLGSELRKLNVPLFSVLEGGYSDQLPELIFAYLCGLSGISLPEKTKVV